MLVCTYQAISGAGKTFASWPEMVDNVIPYIGGEEEKSEQEPLKIWGQDGKWRDCPRHLPRHSRHSACACRCPTDIWPLCIASFDNKPSIGRNSHGLEILPRRGRRSWSFPAAPKQFLHYFEEDNHASDPPGPGSGKRYGRLALGVCAADTQYDYKFVGLSHNTLRGAAGGAVLLAELLCAEGYMA